MPEYTRGRRRDTYTLVRLTNNPSTFYAFYRKDYSGIQGIANNSFAPLGHTTNVSVPPGSYIFLRAQAPKPARVKRFLNRDAGPNEQIAISTFCSPLSINSAQNAGWRLTKPPRSVVLRNARSVTAIAELSTGALYCFPLNSTDYDAWRVELGLTNFSGINSATERALLVSGSSIPRPGKVERPNGRGGKQTTFVATGSEDAAERAGWTVVTREFV